MGKIESEYLKYFWPLRHYLVTCGSGGEANIIAVGFCIPVSENPPMVTCAIGRKTRSAGLMKQTGEFVVNMPPQDLERQVRYCGTHSGWDVDKFAETGLTPQASRHVAAPIVGECVAHVECGVDQIVATGDKHLFSATVIDAYADEDLERGRRNAEYAAGEFPREIYGTRFPERE